jgi:hypothetical protein
MASVEDELQPPLLAPDDYTDSGKEADARNNNDDDDDKYFDDFDDTTSGIEYLENTLKTPFPVSYLRRTDANLVVHLALHDVELLRTLLEAHAVFPRNSVMLRVCEELDYNSEAARLLLKHGAVPHSNWLLDAIKLDDEDACKRLVSAGACKDSAYGTFYYHEGMEILPENSSRYYAELERDPKSCFRVRKFILEHFHLDLALVRTIPHDVFGYTIDEHVWDDGKESTDYVANLSEILGIQITLDNWRDVKTLWARQANCQDVYLLHAAASKLTESDDPNVDDMERLADGSRNAFQIMAEASRHPAPFPGTNSRMMRDNCGGWWGELDESDDCYDSKFILSFLMSESLPHLDLRLKMLSRLIDNNIYNLNAAVCIESYFVGDFDSSCQFHHCHGIDLDGEYHVKAWSNLLDLAIGWEFKAATRLLLEMGANPDFCLPMTRVWLDDPSFCVLGGETYNWAWSALLDCRRKKLERMWNKLRAVAKRVTLISQFVQSLFHDIFRPDGPVGKRARLSFCAASASSVLTTA